MTAELVVVVPGKPVPMGRPRVSFGGGAPRARTPERTRAWVSRIHGFAMAAASSCGWRPRGDDWLAIEIEVSPQRNASGSDPAPGARGDLDNHVKSALDGLNGIAYRDDGQVVEIAARFTPPTREGALRIVVRRASPPPAPGPLPRG